MESMIWRVIAAGQVGASNAAGKERIAGDEQLERGKVEADRALGVAGGVDHLGGVAVQAHNQAIGQVFVGRGGFRRGNADPAGLRLHHFEQRQVIFIEEDGSAGEMFQPERAAHVVDVGVGDAESA